MNKLKFLLPLIAVVITVAGVFAMKTNKKSVKNGDTTLYFHYTPFTMSDMEYIDAGNWHQSSPVEAGCTAGSITCLVPIESTELDSYTDPTEEEKFAHFLSDQASPSSYVLANRTGEKSLTDQ